MRENENLAENIEVERRGASAVIRFALIPLAAVLGFGIGIKFPNIFQGGQGSTKPSTELSSESTKPSAKLSSEVRVETSKLGKTFLGILHGERVRAYKYTGGDVEFWIEMERDDEKGVEPSKTKQKTQQIYLKFLHGISIPAPDSNQTIEGYYVWVRGETDKSGRENWMTGFRRDLVSTQNSDIKNSTGDRWKWHKVQVWKRKVPEGGLQPGSSLGAKEVGTVSISIPTDQEVCIDTISHYRFERGKWFDRDKPLLGAYEKVVLKVMCKVASNKRKTEKGETPGQ